METALNRYEPDYAVPPGWILEEYLQVRGLSPTGFARQCKYSPSLINGILSGKTRLDSEMASRLEKAFGLDASVWLGIESNYQARQKEIDSRSESLAPEQA